MDKGINQVRKSIAERRRMRNIGSGNSAKSNRNATTIVPSDEEKHGYYPNFPEASSKNKQTPIVLNGILIKAVLSVCLFLGVTILQQTNFDLLAKPKEWTSYAITEEFPFARIHHWYKETLGSPLAFSPDKKGGKVSSEPIALPVNGNIKEGFQTNGSGIMIAPESASTVTAWDNGVIIFAGNDRSTHKTIVIQHVNGSKSTYALLSSIDVHLYQGINAGQRIGTFNPTKDNETIYFSVEKDKEFIDPIEAIQVDVDDHT